MCCSMCSMHVRMLLISPQPLCSDLVLYGVGYHHAGMDVSDRKAVETLFTGGELPVLCMWPTRTM